MLRWSTINTKAGDAFGVRLDKANWQARDARVAGSDVGGSIMKDFAVKSYGSVFVFVRPSGRVVNWRSW